MTEWTDYRGEETMPDLDRKVEVRGRDYISGVYQSAGELRWDFMPLDGTVRWRYLL